MPVIPHLVRRRLMQPGVGEMAVDVGAHGADFIGRQEIVDDEEPLPNALVHALPRPPNPGECNCGSELCRAY